MFKYFVITLILLVDVSTKNIWILLPNIILKNIAMVKPAPEFLLFLTNFELEFARWWSFDSVNKEWVHVLKELALLAFTEG